MPKIRVHEMLNPAPRGPSSVAPLRHALTDDWLPEIAWRDVAALNALYRHRRPIEALIGGRAVTIEVTPDTACKRAQRVFRLNLGGQPAVLRLADDVLDLCLRSLGVQGFEHLGDVQAGMLLELAFLPLLKTLETQLQTDIQVLRRLEAAEESEGLIPLRFLLRGLPSGDSIVELMLSHESADRLARTLDEFAVPSPAAAQLPVSVRLCCDSIDLTCEELSSLRPGDIVLPDRLAGEPKPMLALIAERFGAYVERGPDGLRLTSGLQDFHADAEGEWSMEQPADAVQEPALDEAALEQLPIRVVFEIGRLELPLAELRRLGPGYLLPLARPTENAVDIVANGGKIGTGSLVKIGDSIGVRVEKLVAND